MNDGMNERERERERETARPRANRSDRHTRNRSDMVPMCLLTLLAISQCPWKSLFLTGAVRK